MFDLGKLGNVFRGGTPQAEGEQKPKGNSGMLNMMSQFFPGGGAAPGGVPAAGGAEAAAAAPEGLAMLAALSDENSKENVKETNAYDTMRSFIGRKK